MAMRTDQDVDGTILPFPAPPSGSTAGRTMEESVSAPLTFTANDCLDIGQALGSPVSLDYRDKAPFKFNGTINEVHVKYLDTHHPATP